MRVELTGRQPLLRREIRTCAADEGWLVLDARRLLFASPLDLSGMVALAHTAAENTRVALVVPDDAQAASYLQRMDVIRRLPASTVIKGRLPEEERTDCSRLLLEVSPLMPTTADELASQVGRLMSGRFAAGVAAPAFRSAGELIDNAASHGHSQIGAFLCAQTYTGATSKRPGFEFAICDTGIGVQTTFAAIRTTVTLLTPQAPSLARSSPVYPGPRRNAETGSPTCCSAPEKAA